MRIVDYLFFGVFVAIFLYMLYMIAADIRIRGYSKLHWWPFLTALLLLLVNVFNVLWTAFRGSHYLYINIPVLVLNILLIASAFLWHYSVSKEGRDN
jgi:hypothetical protein